MISQQLLVNDNSTFANFSSWASAISAFFAACGWAQSADTGQVMWSGLSITAVSVSGSNATYSYSLSSGLSLAVGRALTITGMTHSQNNGTFVITAIGTGTFTVVNASAVNETGSTGVVTANSTVPGTGATVYEIWTPNDGLTTFYVKIQYGNLSSGTNYPTVILSMGTSTNGAGTLTGFTTSTLLSFINGSGVAGVSATIPFICNFSGGPGRIGFMMWQNCTNNQVASFFGIERSLNSSGAYTNSYATIFIASSVIANFQGALQMTLVFATGQAPAPTSTNTAQGWSVRNGYLIGTTLSYNGKVPFDTPSPQIGYFDYPCTICGIAVNPDITEGSISAITIYGTSHNYLFSKQGQNFGRIVNLNGLQAAVGMRFD